jgi:hypothetical protein
MKGLILKNDTGQKEAALEQFKKVREWRPLDYCLAAARRLFAIGW